MSSSIFENQKIHLVGTQERSFVSILDSYTEREEKLQKNQVKMEKFYTFTKFILVI